MSEKLYQDFSAAAADAAYRTGASRPIRPWLIQDAATGKILVQKAIQKTVFRFTGNCSN